MECFLCNFLCKNPTFGEKREVKKFNKDIWLACKTFLSARKHHQHKYRDVVLPDSWNDGVIGYHSSCYKKFGVKSKYLSYERLDVSKDDLCAELSDSSNSPTFFERPKYKAFVSSTPIQNRAKIMRQVLPFESPSSRLSMVPKLGHSANKMPNAVVSEKYVEKQKALLEDILTSNKKILDSPLPKRYSQRNDDKKTRVTPIKKKRVSVELNNLTPKSKINAMDLPLPKRNSERNGEEETQVTPIKKKRVSTELNDLIPKSKINGRPSLFYPTRNDLIFVPNFEIVSLVEDQENEKNNNTKTPIKNKTNSATNKNTEENSPSKSLREKKITEKKIAEDTPSKKSQNVEKIRKSDIVVEDECFSDVNVDNEVFAKPSNPQNQSLNSVSKPDRKVYHKNALANGVLEDDPISKNTHSVEKEQVSKSLAKSLNEVNKSQELLKDGVDSSSKYRHAGNVELTQKKDRNEKVILKRNKQEINEQKIKNKRKKQSQIEPYNQLLEKESPNTGTIGQASNGNATSHDENATSDESITGDQKKDKNNRLIEKTDKKVRRVKNNVTKQTTSDDKTDINSGNKSPSAKKSVLFINSDHSEKNENVNNGELRMIEKDFSDKKEDSKRKKEMKNFDEQRNKRIPERNEDNESTQPGIRKTKRIRRKPGEYWSNKRSDFNLEPATPITPKERPKWLEKVLAEKNDPTMFSSNAKKEISIQQLFEQNKIANTDRNSENNLLSKNKNSLEKGKQSSPIVKKKLSTKSVKKALETIKIVERSNRKGEKQERSKKPQKMKRNYRPDSINSNENSDNDDNVDRSNIIYEQVEKLSPNEPKKRGEIPKKITKLEANHRPNTVITNENAESDEDVNEDLFLDEREKKLSANQPEKTQRRLRNPQKMKANYRPNAVNYNEDSDKDDVDGQEKRLSANQPEKKRRPNKIPKMEAIHRPNAVNSDENANSDDNAIGGLSSDRQEKNSSANEPRKKRERPKKIPTMEANYRPNVVNSNEESDEDVNGGLFFDGWGEKLIANQPGSKNPLKRKTHQPNVNYDENESSDDERVCEDFKKTLKEKSNRKKKTQSPPNIRRSDDKDKEQNLKVKRKKKNEKIAKAVISDNDVEQTMNQSPSKNLANGNLLDEKKDIITVLTENGPVEFKCFIPLENLSANKAANGLSMSDGIGFFGTVARYLQIAPKAVKDKTIPKKSSMIFVVLEGHVKFEIFKSTFYAKPGDQLVVPRFVPYSIENQSNTTKAVLYNVAVDQ